MNKYDRSHDVRYTNFVGTIIYEDERQIAVSVKDGKMVWYRKIPFIIVEKTNGTG